MRPPASVSAAAGRRPPSPPPPGAAHCAGFLPLRCLPCRHPSPPLPGAGAVDPLPPAPLGPGGGVQRSIRSSHRRRGSRWKKHRRGRAPTSPPPPPSPAAGQGLRAQIPSQQRAYFLHLASSVHREAARGGRRTAARVSIGSTAGDHGGRGRFDTDEKEEERRQSSILASCLSFFVSCISFLGEF
ncbi:hypothetical protein DAI22_06g134950 [Oryza sativa Japonica Group]|nr:hypothetical protein DAI22_06g134950 [Oryza sativa Japonica Group]